MNDPTHARAHERGFTLVELMVVVAIIALLATIIVPNYVHARAQAAVSQTEANLHEIATALELYRDDQHHYPQASANVTPVMFNVGTAGNNPYLTTTPKNSTNLLPYTYVYHANNGQTDETYTLNDPGIYDASTLTTLPQGTAGANGATGGTALCTACTTIHYAPDLGLFGT